MLTEWKIGYTLWNGNSYVYETHTFFNEQLARAVYEYLKPCEDTPMIRLAQNDAEVARKTADIITLVYTQDTTVRISWKKPGDKYEEYMATAKRLGQQYYEEGAGNVAVYRDGGHVKTWCW